jgi:Gp157 protein
MMNCYGICQSSIRGIEMNPSAIQQQIANLLLAHPELAEDDILRADTLEGQTDLHEFLRMIERRRQEAEHMTEAIARNIVALGERKDRIERREQAMRKLMLQVMEAANLRKVEIPEATISVRAGSERLVINDETSVPRELCRVKYTPDKERIKDMLKSGTSVNWAAIVTGEPSVTIRTT